jgi:large subunit ribosomal protein L29
MKPQEIRDLNTDELEQRIAELEEEVFRLKLQNATGQLDNPMRIRQLRRDMARCKTIQRQKARQEQGA